MTYKTVPKIQVGQIVRTGAGNRAFKVLSNREYVTYTDGRREGPYCRLQALDDKILTVIYPREWYYAPGETRQLFA